MKSQQPGLKPFGIFSLLVILSLVLSACGAQPGTLGKKGPEEVGPRSSTEAVLSSVKGIVKVIDGTGAETIAAAGQPVTLTVGKRVLTGPLSSAHLEFYDGSQVFVGPSSELAIVELDAQRGSKTRTIVLSQVIGETRHQVAKSQNKESSYLVQTPSASGYAVGTEFNVSVSADLKTRLTVTEGEVAVYGQDETVHVTAGQETSVDLDEPPATPFFYVVGEGMVTQVGATWVIGGQEFAIAAATVFVGDPKIGDIVHVEGHLDEATQTRVADRIVLLQASPANEFTMSGLVEVIGDASWTVQGQTIAITTETTIDAEIEVGDQVQVEGVLTSDGTLRAVTIHKMDAGLGLPYEFSGPVTSTGETEWVVGAQTVLVNAETVIAAEIVTGSLVKVEGWIQEDGTWLAAEISLAGDLEHRFEIAGAIESIDPWTVAGVIFEIREWTEMDAELVVGDQVQVEGSILEDGTWVASEIKKVEEEVDNTLTLIGTVHSVDPWIVSGKQLVVTEESVIDGEIEVGALVQVEIRLMPDGTWEIIHMAPLSGMPWVPGCMTITARVVSLDGNMIQLEGWPEPLTVGADIPIQGQVMPESIVQLQVCFNEDNTMQVMYIVVIEDEEVEDEEPGEEDGGGEAKVTVCHKPNKKKGGHVITIAEPAVPAHLAHGDTLGACQAAP